MAGAKDFNKGIRGIRSGCESCKKKKETNPATFDKYKIYNTSRWRILRERTLRANPICNVCKKELALEVDHIIPFSTGMTDRQKFALGFDRNNLQSICKDCHDIKHNRIKKDKDNED